jgi:hypothetical protein
MRYEKSSRLLVLLVLLAIVAHVGDNLYAKNDVRVKVSNPSSFARNSETISLSMESLTSKLPSLNLGNAVVVDENSGVELITQVVDGELLFQSSFKPKETKSFFVRAGMAKSEKPQSLVDGRFVEPRQDYAWENDRIAFRMYGPALAKEVNNGIDVWTKRVRSLVVEKWYKGDQDTGTARVSYHVDHGEGADFFSVGRTLGAGSCGLWYNNKVYQPGVFSSYRTIANGPIRLVFELTYDSLRLEGRRYKETKHFTLDAGQNLNRIEATYTGEQSNEELQVVAGLVKRKGVTFSKDEKEGWFSLWGLTNADTINGSLGMGIVMPSTTLKTAFEDTVQYLVNGKAKTGKPFVYYAGAGWTRTGDFADESAWREYLSAFARRLRAPLVVRIGG